MQPGINRKTLFLFFVSVFLIKLISVGYLSMLSFCLQPQLAGGKLAILNGDAFSYIGAMENYVSKGSYYFINDDNEKVFAGRMPYYATPYFLFRQFFSPAVSLDLLVILQVLIESLAILCLALLVYDITKRKYAFYISIALSLAGLFITFWSYATITDGLCANLLIISAYYFYKHIFYTGSKKPFIGFSVLLAIVVCLRPYFSLIYLFIGIYELIRFRNSFSAVFRQAFILSVPLLLLLTPWIVRNYVLFNRFIPFQQDAYAGYNYGQDELMIRKVLAALGEDGNSYWDDKTAASFFHKKTAAKSRFNYPNYLQQDSTAFRKIESLRVSYLTKANIDNGIKEEASAFLNFYRSEFPARYYIVNHLKRISKFLFNSGSYYLPISSSSACYKSYQYLLKLSQSFLYYALLILGFVGLIKACMKDGRFLFLLVPTLFLVILFPISLHAIEWRFFIPFYYFHQAGLVLLLFFLFDKYLQPIKLLR